LDRRLFKRVMQNLIQNAFEHNEDPVKVNVHVTTDDVYCVHIVIEDDGKGLIRMSFQKFYTLLSWHTHAN
jgi:signal transduction histidine kinase